MAGPPLSSSPPGGCISWISRAASVSQRHAWPRLKWSRRLDASTRASALSERCAPQTLHHEHCILHPDYSLNLRARWTHKSLGNFHSFRSFPSLPREVRRTNTFRFGTASSRDYFKSRSARQTARLSCSVKRPLALIHQLPAPFLLRQGSGL